MLQLPGRLGTLKACDVMTKQVILLKDTDTIEQAVRQLKEQHITGAPVVDNSGIFVGILSVSDLIGRTKPGTDEPELPPVPLSHGDDDTTWDLFEKAYPLNEDVSAEAVGSRMTKRVTSVTETAPLVEVAQVMCRGHWHRVPVVNEGGSLIGIISTMDILAALVNTAEEDS